ncbi:MAG: GerMN domain-containing protein [Acidimicrobiia bacterium]
MRARLGRSGRLGGLPLALALALALALMLSGCGVPTDGQPVALGEGVVPPDLLGNDPVTTTTTVPAGSTARVRVYLLGGGVGAERLVPVDRVVQAPATVERVMSQLTLEPTREEKARGLRNAVLPGTVINSVLIESNIAIVDLAEGPISVGGVDEQILALAQMVYSATELREIGAVRFTVEGVRAGIPDASGVQSTAPVGRAAYATYAPL